MKKINLSIRLSIIIVFLQMFSNVSAQTQTVIIPASSTWNYKDNGSNQGTIWRAVSFNDSTWNSGPAELGFGDSPATTLTRFKVGYYFRKTINIQNPAQFSGYNMKLRRDDGIVVYINSVEVYRNNMPAGIINYNTRASSTCSDDGHTVFSKVLPDSLFTAGDNVIAVEVHNRSTTSSDITFELQLFANQVQSGTCDIPDSNLFVSDNITSTSVNVNWDFIAGALSYDIEYKILNSPGGYSAPINTLTDSLVLTNLLPGTNYQFIVQSNCSSNSSSAYSGIGTFSTLPIVIGTCAKPNYLYFGTTHKTSNSAEVNWNAVQGVQSYNVEYRIRNIGAAYSNPINTTSTFLVLANLQPMTNYEFIVQSVCSGSGLSLFSPSGWFTTLSGTVSNITLLRGPYLTIATSNSVTVQWRTNAASSNEVNYDSNSVVLNSTAGNSYVGTEHSVTLSGLQPNTKYYYTIGSIGQVLQGDADNYFYTASIDGSSEPVRFWVTGDFGNGSSGQLAVRNSFLNYTSGQNVNGWLWLGDNAYNNGTDQEYQGKVFNIYNSIFKNTPVFPAPGNHDYAQAGYQSNASLGTNFPYFKIFTLPTASGTEKYYSTNYGNIHFISLDSYGSYNGSSSAMYNWLDNDLANNTQLWTIVYFHHPPYSKGSHNSDTEDELIDMRNNIVPLIESYGVDLVLCGHSHVYERSFFIKNHFGPENTFNSTIYPGGNIVESGGGPYTKVTRTGNGTVYVVCGNSGQNAGSTKPGFPHNAMFESIITGNGSLILDIDGSDLTCQYLSSTGNVDDEFTINKTIPAPLRASKISGKNEDHGLTTSIYPNPSSGDLNIRINNQEIIKVSVLIYNMEGSMLFNSTFSKAKGENIQLEKSRTNLTPGIYMLNVAGDNFNSSTKVVVN